MAEEFSLVHDPRNVFQLFENFFAEELSKDFVLETKTSYLLQCIPRAVFEVYPVNFFVELEDHVVVVQLEIDVEPDHIPHLYLGHLYMAQLHQFVDYL